MRSEGGNTGFRQGLSRGGVGEKRNWKIRVKVRSAVGRIFAQGLFAKASIGTFLLSFLSVPLSFGSAGF